MQDLPHRYHVCASGGPQGSVAVEAERLPALETAAPAEFGGPGDLWSPETLLVAAAADCFILSFRGVMRASKFEWESLACKADGVLDRVEGKTRFTAFSLHASLRIPSTGDKQEAQRLLERAEQGCLITNSLIAETTLETSVEYSSS